MIFICPYCNEIQEKLIHDDLSYKCNYCNKHYFVGGHSKFNGWCELAPTHTMEYIPTLLKIKYFDSDDLLIVKQIYEKWSKCK